MKLKELRRLRRHSRWAEGIFRQNPVLIQGLALPFVIIAATNLKSSVALSLMMACCLIPTVLLASLFGRRLPGWASPVLYTLFSLAVLVAAAPLITTISPDILDGLGIYVPLLAVNSTLLTLCGRHEEKGLTIFALTDAVCYSVGFALAACLIAIPRELWGNNTIWGQPVSLPVKLSGLQIAFSGFLVTAFLAALFRFIRRLVLFGQYRHENPAPPKEEKIL